jgi:hypothetical protein
MSAESDKYLILTAFNNQFFEFVDDVESVFYDDASIKKVKSALQLIRKMNPSMIIKIWYKYITLPYETEIQNNNLNFFIEKDYKNDLRYISSAEDITRHIDVLRDPIRNMGTDNQNKSFKYIQNLCLLATLYSE